MHILLVDDNNDVRQTLATLLQNAGHRVESCPDGDDAWSKLKGNTHDYELVVTDVRMPHMNGVEFASRLRAQGSQTPIIFIMGGAETELEQPQADFVPYTVVQKPFMLSTFLDAVSEVSQLAS